MTDDLASLVQPILRRGLAARERLERGERLDVEVEQTSFKALLLTEFEAQRWPEFGGESDATSNGRPLLGARFALACWLDELFRDTSWADSWRPLEAALYGTTEGACKFWEQARRAEVRADTDALETYFLCVVLGFRGERRHNPEQVRQWLTATQARLTTAQNLHWQGPADLEPPVHTERLSARGRWRTLVLASGFALLAVIPTATYYVVRQLGH